MTTQVTVVTHGWPVSVLTQSVHNATDADGKVVARTTTVTEGRQERYMTGHYVVTDTQTVQVVELTHEGWQDAPVEEAEHPEDGGPDTPVPTVADSDGDDAA